MGKLFRLIDYSVVDFLICDVEDAGHGNDHLHNCAPNSFHYCQFHCSGAGFSEQGSYSFICIKPLYDGQKVVLYSGKRSAGKPAVSQNVAETHTFPYGAPYHVNGKFDLALTVFVDTFLDVSICRSEYLLLNRVDRSNSVRSLMLRPDIMSIILFIAFEASLFLKNAFISERKFVPLDLSIGFVTASLVTLKLLIFCQLQKYPMLFLCPLLYNH